MANDDTVDSLPPQEADWLALLAQGSRPGADPLVVRQGALVRTAVLLQHERMTREEALQEAVSSEAVEASWQRLQQRLWRERHQAPARRRTLYFSGGLAAAAMVVGVLLVDPAKLWRAPPPIQGEVPPLERPVSAPPVAATATTPLTSKGLELFAPTTQVLAVNPLDTARRWRALLAANDIAATVHPVADGSGKVTLLAQLPTTLSSPLLNQLEELIPSATATLAGNELTIEFIPSTSSAALEPSAQ